MSKTDYLSELEGSEVPHVAEGTYLALLDGVEQALTRFGSALKWHWTLPHADNFELVQMTSTATTGGSNAGKNIRALTGRGLAPGEKLSTTALVGRQATLVLYVDSESGWNKVEAVYPAATEPSQATVEHYAEVADAEEPKAGSAAAFQKRIAEQKAAAEAATFGAPRAEAV